MWMSISKSYKFRCINESLRVYYLSQDGIMQNNTKNEDVKMERLFIAISMYFLMIMLNFSDMILSLFKGSCGIYNFALYKLKESHLSAFRAIKSPSIKALYGVVYCFYHL